MKRYKVIVLLLIILQAMSCKKNFLEVPDESRVFRQTYVTNLKTLNEFLSGIYTLLASRLYDGYPIIYGDLAADNVKPLPGAGSLFPHYNWTQQADNNTNTTMDGSSLNLNPQWAATYKIASACSFVLEKIGEYRSQDPVKADYMAGQAYALRALCHFWAVNLFAQPYSYTTDGSHTGVPYVKTSDWTTGTTRQSVAQVYENMIADLSQSLTLLEPTSPDIRFMNRNAARALLARVYLFKGDYQKAKNEARTVGMAVPIMTGTNYPSKLFTAQETEAIFQLPPANSNAAGGAGGYDSFVQGLWYADPLLSFTATSDIAIILKEYPLDKRVAWVKDTLGVWQVRKYPTNISTLSTFLTNTFHYQTFIRSSEMYLIAAESYAKVNNEDSARYYLDAIRIRANATASATTATGTALLDSIYKERRKELAFEGFRLFDLQRWKKGVTRIDALAGSPTLLPYPADRAIGPLPLQDVTVGGLQQNNGY